MFKKNKMASKFDIFIWVFVIVTCLRTIAASGDIKDDVMEKTAHGERDALWFGPRLGKRSLQLFDEDQTQAILRLLEAADLVKDFYDPSEMQRDAPRPKAPKKLIITPKHGRITETQRNIDRIEFTPRLGRKLAERIANAPADEELYRSDPMVMSSMPNDNHFTPRLGRNNYNFSPRLGRDLVYGLYAQPQIRIARSVNKTQAN